MKHLIIVGAGEFGRELYWTIQGSLGFGKDYDIKGFIDDDLNALDGYPNYPPIIGTIKNYQPQTDDVFVSSIGGAARRPCMEEIIARGGEFLQLVHKMARIYTNAQLGKGNFIGAYTVIGNDAVVGDYNMIQSYTVIGHDAHIGSWNRIDTHVTCVGGTIVEDDVNIHTGAVISHNVKVESGAHVGACSFVIKKVKAGTTVMGNPAKKLM